MVKAYNVREKEMNCEEIDMKNYVCSKNEIEGTKERYKRRSVYIIIVISCK